MKLKERYVRFNGRKSKLQSQDIVLTDERIPKGVAKWFVVYLPEPDGVVIKVQWSDRDISLYYWIQVVEELYNLKYVGDA